jgi:replicative DNA helicase
MRLWGSAMPAPPSNIDAERELIGAMFLRPEIIPAVRENISSLDFYLEAHKDLFAAITPRSTLIEVGEKLQRNPAALKAMAAAVETVSTSAGWKSHAKIIKTKSLLRQWLSLGSYLSEICNEHEADPDIIASEAKAVIRDIEAEIESDYLDMPRIVNDTLQEIRERGKGQQYTMKTGLDALDDALSGYERGTYNLVIARPSIGKTAFALKVAKEASTHEPGITLFWSLEMAYRAVTRRLLADESQIHLSKLKSGNIYHTEIENLDIAAKCLSQANMIIADHPKYREIERLIAATESIATQKTLSCVIIDHIQKTTSQKRYNSDNSKYEYISGEIAAMAKALNVPVIVLCQLNRQLESRPEHQRRPRLENIRSSGAFEQDADTVIGLHRESRHSRILHVEGLKDRDGGAAGRLLFFEFNGATQTISDIDQAEAQSILAQEKNNFSDKQNKTTFD